MHMTALMRRVLQADGKARNAGLSREEGHYINDRRVMDGFKVPFHGPSLRVKYQAEVRIKDVKNVAALKTMKYHKSSQRNC